MGNGTLKPVFLIVSMLQPISFVTFKGVKVSFILVNKHIGR